MDNKYNNDTYTGSWGKFQRKADLFSTVDRLGLCRSYVDPGRNGHEGPSIVVGYLTWELNHPNNADHAFNFFSEVKYIRKCREEGCE